MFLVYGVIVVVAVCILGPTAPVWMPELYKRVARPSLAAKEIVALLNRDPEGWNADQYVLMHPASRIGIWIANEEYGIRFWLGPRQDGHNINRAKPADRFVIWRATKRRKLCLEDRKDTALISAARAAGRGK